MKKLIIKYGVPVSFIALIISCNTNKQHEPVQLKYENEETVTYEEAINIYEKLDKEFKTAKLFTYDATDIGKPLHLFVISKDKDFDPESIRENDKCIILINNGIHPGEPCGIDASIKFADEILRNENGLANLLDNTVICIIPVYNIGGALNRSPYNRACQDSPKECGFRGNAQNIDLNRDFVKCDTRNAQTFSKIFHLWKPDVLLDTHTTDGSDHQYVITLIPAQHNNLSPVLDEFFDKEMIPSLYRKMKEGPYEMIPYVDYFYDDPKKGMASYITSPKYSTGYVTLFNTLSFMTETHIFKHFRDRVLSVYQFIVALAEYTNNNAEKIRSLRNHAIAETITAKEFPIQWELDTTISVLLPFKGYEAKYKTSLLTGLQRLYYEKNEPYEKEIPYYDNFKPTLIIQKPAFYIIPQAWREAVERLELNNIAMKRLSKDTTLLVEVYYITHYTPSNRSYNGRYPHYSIETRACMQSIKYYKGDYVVEMNQEGNRYVVEMLEPKATDSFFAWNFFDPILEKREYFSPFVFEEKAIAMLDTIPGLKELFEKEKKLNPSILENHYAQLKFIYEHSPYAEKTFMRYPVARINNWQQLSLE